MDPLAKLLMEHYGMPEEAAVATAGKVLGVSQPAGPNLVRPLDTDRQARSAMQDAPSDGSRVARQIALREGQVRPEDVVNRSAEDFIGVMGQVPRNMARLDQRDQLKEAEKRLYGKGFPLPLEGNEIITEAGGDTNPSDPDLILPVSPVSPEAPVPGKPGHPMEDQWGGITNAIDAMPKGSNIFQGFTHQEAMDLINHYLQTKRMRTLGEWDPSMMSGPT